MNLVLFYDSLILISYVEPKLTSILLNKKVSDPNKKLKKLSSLNPKVEKLDKMNI